MPSKACPRCETDKPTSDFNKDATSRDGLQGYCKSCIKAYQVAYRAANPEKVKAYSVSMAQTPAGRFTSYKKGAKTRGILFSLSMEDFMSFWQVDCSYCGGAIATIGLDRVDNSAGYEIGNVVACCTMCNKVKSNHDNDMLNDHLLRMLRHQGVI